MHIPKENILLICNFWYQKKKKNVGRMKKKKNSMSHLDHEDQGNTFWASLFGT